MIVARSLRLMGALHGRSVHSRRSRRLASELAPRLPAPGRWLDIGCGDGHVAALVSERRPDVSFDGVDTRPRPSCAIACRVFDGERLPFPDAEFSGCLFVDVLHHIEDPVPLLREAMRVGRGRLVIKDHLSGSRLDRATLRFMDWVGNTPHGVVLPYAYLSEQQWHALFARLHLRTVFRTENVPIYPFPFSYVFGRRLHFIAVLEEIR